MMRRPASSLPHHKVYNHGQGEDPRKPGRDWARRCRQVDHHRSPDLQVRWYRQACDREVREGGR
eukprot:38114-Eustigmatos_ZCMA.PRE.1